MAYVRRHWLKSVLYSLVIILGLAIFLTPVLFSENAPDAAQAQASEPQPIDPYLYTRVQKLRQELSLTNRDLAAMGYTEESARLLLDNLKTWCSTNQVALDRHHRAEIKAKVALREAIRQINTSTLDDRVSDVLPGLQDDLKALHEQRQTSQDTLVAQIESRMDTNQLKIYQSARANTGLPSQLRYAPDLTDEQRLTFYTQLTDRSRRGSRSQVLADELTLSQKQGTDSVGLNTTSKARYVRNAEATVLPVPDVLKPDVESYGE